MCEIKLMKLSQVTTTLLEEGGQSLRCLGEGGIVGVEPIFANSLEVEVTQHDGPKGA